MPYKTRYRLLPRPILSVLHEPLVDPRDGHGARSTHDIMILRLWKAARAGDDGALVDLVKHIVREDLSTLRAARKERQWRVEECTVKVRTLIPAAKALGMVTTEKVEVPPEWDGPNQVTTRQAITFVPWFADHAFKRERVSAAAVDYAKAWLASGGIHRPYRGEGH